MILLGLGFLQTLKNAWKALLVGVLLCSCLSGWAELQPDLSVSAFTSVCWSRGAGCVLFIPSHCPGDCTDAHFQQINLLGKSSLYQLLVLAADTSQEADASQ